MGVYNYVFDAIIKTSAEELIEDDVKLLHSIDTSNTKISKKIDRKVRKRIKKYDKKSLWAELPNCCRYAIAALLIFCTLSFGLCLSIEALRSQVIDIFVEWCDKFVSVFYVSEHIPPNTIEEYREPKLQLAGTNYQVILKTDKIYQIIYTKNSEVLMIYQQMELTDQSIDIDNEKCVIEETRINGNKAQLFLYDDMRVAITWHDHEYKYLITTLSSDVTRDLIINIAESI